MRKNLYYTKVLMQTEADRCLNCPNKPCASACPIGCDPQFFIQKVKEHDLKAAAKAIREKNPLGEICGLVCPKKLCMQACVRSKIDYPINIAKIQATVLADETTDDFSVCIPQKEKMAVVGAGPAGIGAAVSFAKNGFYCTLFEKQDKIGGMVNLIPKSRLPEKTTDKEMANILSLPFLQVKTDSKIRNPIQLLQEGYDYVVVSTGEPRVKKLNIPGEKYIISWFDFLLHPEQKIKIKKAAVIGGGNVALDCAEVLRKDMGVPSVELFIRRPFYGLRIAEERVVGLLREKININPLMLPVKVEKNGDKLSLYVARTVMEKDCPVQTQDILRYDDFDLIIQATGSKADKVKHHKNVFYAGDAKTSSSSVVEALADGIKTAQEIMAPLLNLK